MLVSFAAAPILVDVILLRWEAPWLWSNATWCTIGGVMVFLSTLILMSNDFRPAKKRQMYSAIAAILLGGGIGIVYEYISVWTLND